jgi:hypothetical protein
LGLHGKPWGLAIDRTNWEFGRTTINILMLSVEWNGIGIPLLWTLLPAPGNSDTQTRICLLDRLRQIFPALQIAALTGELLARATSSRPRHALARYRARWKIESLFGNLKTRGFNLEATHLADPAKLSTLMALIALAVAISVKTGVATQRLRPVAIKAHGRKAQSLFAHGLTTLRKIFASASHRQVFVFLETLLSPKPPAKLLKSMAI